MTSSAISAKRPRILNAGYQACRLILHPYRCSIAHGARFGKSSYLPEDKRPEALKWAGMCGNGNAEQSGDSKGADQIDFHGKPLERRKRVFAGYLCR